MASPHSTFLRTLYHATRNTLHHFEEVEVVVEAAEQISSLRHRHLASPWDLPKLLASALRVQLNARLRATAAVESSLSPVSLSRLLVTAWRLCPLVTLPLSRAAHDVDVSSTSFASLISITDEDMKRVELEIASLDNVPSSENAAQTSSRDTAIAVLTSLLIYWHMLTGEAHEATAEDEEVFQLVSNTVWRCVHRWAAADDCADVLRTFLSTWVNTVLRRALRSAGGLCAMSAVTLLDIAAQSGVGRGTFMDTVSRAPSIAALGEPWAKLHLRLCQQVMVDIRARQTAFSTEWNRSVIPVLSSAFAHEPPLLSASFTSVVQFAEPLDSSLSELMRVVRCVRQRTLSSSATMRSGVLAPCVSADALSPLLHWASFSQRLVASGVPVASFNAADTFSTYAAPLIAVSLRWGLVAEACALLDWCADGLDEHGSRWRQRLHRILSGVTLDSPAELLTSSHIRDGGLPYVEWIEGINYTSANALDVLAICHDIRQLRPVCDALLRRRPAEWAKEVLQDPFAPSFLVGGLIRLIDALLQARDAPLARFYLTLLGRLLPRCSCPPQLEVLLQLVHRFATVITTTHLSAANYATPTSRTGVSLAGWRRLKTALERADAELADHADTASVRYLSWPWISTAGLAWKTRRHLQDFCLYGVLHSGLECDDAAASAPMLPERSAVALGTVVEICYISAGSQGEEGQLWIRRTRASSAWSTKKRDTQCGQLTDLTVRCDVGGLLQACAAEVTEVMSRNRLQLMRGTVSAAAEIGRCLGSQDPHDLASTTYNECQLPCSCAAACSEPGYGGERQRKELWWCERFELDDRIGRVAASMQDVLGAAHVLLAGHPSDSLSSQLDTLAARFAAECIRFRGASRCPPVDAIRQVTLQALVAAPHLWRCTSSSSVQATCFYGPRDAHSCTCCTQTVKQAQRTVLEAITALGQLVVPATAAASGSSLSCSLDSETAQGQDCWWDLLLDAAVQGAVEEMVPEVLQAYYREVTPDAVTTTSSDNVACYEHHHIDLLLVSREHVYLVLDGELHALPWEALDVCQDRSISRVPSLEFVKSCCMDAPAVSLRQTYIYRDDDAVKHDHSPFTEIIAQHPHWEVAYGETLQAASAAARDGGITAASPFLRRLLAERKNGSHHIDLFVYAGHKGGEHLISRAGLYDWIPSAAGIPPTLVLLMGCSSARMQASGLFDCFGLPFAYLSAGVSCVLGCLWDVTDVDIDRLTSRFLQIACLKGDSDEDITVGECLAVARRACKLRYLTGMATVFYGVNCHVGGAREGGSSCPL